MLLREQEIQGIIVLGKWDVHRKLASPFSPNVDPSAMFV
jgi:hypothetical protein